MSANQPVFAEDANFIIDIPSQFDFPSMNNLRLLLTRPGGSTSFYDFTTEEKNAAGVGGMLSYTVRKGDLPRHGRYFFQVITKDAISDLGFPAWYMDVEPRLILDSWATN
ncbi:MAG: hypothetical protein AB9Q19_12570 [Candidatus Reddybacter sp.]